MAKPVLVIIGNNDELMRNRVNSLADASIGEKVIYDQDICTDLKANYSGVDESYMPQYVAMKIDAEIDAVNFPGAQDTMLFIFVENNAIIPLIKHRVTILKIFDPVGYDVKKYKRMKADITITPKDNIVTAVAKYLK